MIVLLELKKDNQYLVCYTYLNMYPSESRNKQQQVNR